MLYVLQIYFLLFMTYAVIGWIAEVVTMIFYEKKVVNRGFLIGPYCPIYGYGAVCMTLLLKPYYEDIIILFGMSVLICSILEYITSYIMEKLFKARWWDYSDYKFNLNGRICLQNAILFGIGGVLIIKLINPIVLTSILNNPPTFLNTLTIVLGVIYILDNLLSWHVINTFKKSAGVINKDSTEEISTKVRESAEELTSRAKVDVYEIKNKINSVRREATEKLKLLYESKNYLHKRLINSFPHLETRSRKTEDLVTEILEKLKSKIK